MKKDPKNLIVDLLKEIDSDLYNAQMKLDKCEYEDGQRFISKANGRILNFLKIMEYL